MPCSDNGPYVTGRDTALGGTVCGVEAIRGRVLAGRSGKGGDG